MSTQEYNLMGKSQFLLLNPSSVRAHDEAARMIGVQKVRISIRARRFDSLHQEAGYMTDALFSFNKSLDSHGWSIHDTGEVFMPEGLKAVISYQCSVVRIFIKAVASVFSDY